jgi:hypothetical protein
MARSSEASRLARIVAICLALPEATCVEGGRAGEHRQFAIRRRTFGYYTYHEHGEDRIAFLCKVAPGEQDVLMRMEAGRFFIPAYIGHRGWVGVRIDQPKVDWPMIEELARNSYRLIAPKSLARLA